MHIRASEKKEPRPSKGRESKGVVHHPIPTCCDGGGTWRVSTLADTQGWERVCRSPACLRGDSILPWECNRQKFGNGGVGNLPELHAPQRITAIHQAADGGSSNICSERMESSDHFRTGGNWKWRETTQLPPVQVASGETYFSQAALNFRGGASTTGGRQEIGKEADKSIKY